MEGSDSQSFRPYLCYVPSDLQEELFYLKSKVFAQLDGLCQKRGIRFRPVDLQQCIQQERDEENNHSDGHQMNKPDLYDQVLKISLDLIDRSSFFICLLGHNYGQYLPANNGSQYDTGPSSLSEMFRNVHVAARAGYPWVLEDEYRTCSLTELEIIKAAFIDNHRSCFFYFKDYIPPDTDDDYESAEILNMLSTQSQNDRQRIRDLKKGIINHCLPVRFFRNLCELGEMVKTDWEEVICKLYEEPNKFISGWQDLFDQRYHERCACALCDWFVPLASTTEILNAINTFLHPITHNAKSETHSRNPEAHLTRDLDRCSSEKSVLLVCGERGCGKSTLATWCLRTFCRQNPEIPVISHLCGSSTSSTDVRSLLRQCTAQLRRAQYGDFPDWNDIMEDIFEFKHLHRVVQAFIAAMNLGPCVLLIDGIDLLTETLGLSKQEVKALQWLPDVLPPYCKIIITTTFTDLTYKSLTGRTDVQILRVPHLTDPNAQLSILLKHPSLPQELPSHVLQKVIRKCYLPLSLALIGTELRTCSVLREKQEEMELMEEYEEADSVSELWVKVIHRWVKDYSRSTPTEDIHSCKVTETHTSSVALRDGLSGWVWDTLCLIHVSRSGLNEDELLALLEDLGYCGHLRVKGLEWAQLCSAIWPWIQEKASGFLTIMHQSFSHAMNLLLHGGEGQNSYHQILTTFFQKSSLEICSWTRKMEEIPWHLKQTGSFKELHEFLINQNTMGFLSTSLKRFPQMFTDVINYWTVLIEKGFDHVTSFHNLMAQILEHHNAAPDHSGMWRSSLFSAEVLLCLGALKQAEVLLLQAHDIFQQEVELDCDSMRLLLKVQHMLAGLYVQMHLLKDTETYCHKGLETAQTLTEAHLHSAEVKLIVGQLLCRLCLALLEDGRVYAVPGRFREFSSDRYISAHPSAEGTVMILKAFQKLSVCELKAAERCFRSALSSRRRWFGPDHPLVAEVEEQLADLWAGAQTSTEWTQRKMVELYRHVINTRETEAQKLKLPVTHHGLAVILRKLGEVLLRSCSKVERTEGLDLLQRAADIRIHFPLTPDPDVSKPDIAEQKKIRSNNKPTQGRSRNSLKDLHSELKASSEA